MSSLPTGQITSQKAHATHFKKYTTAKNMRIPQILASVFVAKKSLI